jgi:large subunit ribosomal protein L9
MEIILLEDVETLGKKGDVAQVAEGYARNFLLPRRLAEIATPARIAMAKQMMEDRAAAARREAERAEENREMLGKTVLTITAPVGTADRLFGSVTNQDVADAIYEARKVRIDKHNIEIEEPIKTVGTFIVKVLVHSSMEPAQVKVIVSPEEEKA